MSSSGNQFTGTIPKTLNKLNKLQHLDLSNNLLTGEIPAGLSELNNNRFLSYIDFSDNRLEGSIPPDIGRLTNFRSRLDFSNNRLSGCFPSSLTALCGKTVAFWGNAGLPSNGSFNLFCEIGLGKDQFIEVRASQSFVPAGNPVSFTASGGASYTWTAPAETTLISPSTASSITALVSGIGPRNFTVTATNNYCFQTRVISVTSVTHPDYAPLAEFFALTNGPNWQNKTGWLSSLDPCSGWFGVSCQNGRVESLSLTANQLQGTLPESLTALTNLQTLDLTNNQLRGCFPTSLTAFCGRTVMLQNNPNLPGAGNWTSFCTNRLGSADFIASVRATPNPVSLGGITSLSASGGTEYRWSGPQNFTGNQGAISLTVLSGEQQGLYSVTVGTGNMSCSAVAVTSLTVSGASCVKLAPLVSSSAVCTRGIVTVTVSATSPEAVSYQWYKGATALTNTTSTIGATSNTLVLADLPLSGAGTYYVVASSGCGSTTSSVFSVSVTPPTHPDYLPLAELFYSTNGLNWKRRTNWLTNCDPCQGWYGVGCYDPTTGNLKDRVHSIYLENNSLRGPLSESIGGLPFLHTLGLSANMLSGPIPANIALLTKLRFLWLSSNQFTGSIPSSLGSLNQLEDLSIGFNQLSGSIPDELGNLNSLKGLYLANNNLSGAIPEGLSSLTTLITLNLQGNQLSGSIPESLTKLSVLFTMTLSYNQLSGSIPTSFSALRTLANLYLSNNQLSGTIPGSLSALTGLANLNLNNNQLSGEIPPSFGALTNLRELRLEHNQLTGTIPASLSTLTGLSTLTLYNNQLSGVIPFSLGNMANLEFLILFNNRLTGSIPSSFSRLSKMRSLQLWNNQLSGCIPLSLTSLCGLNIGVGISNNPGLPGGGNWSGFCATGAGSYAGTLTTTKAGIWTDGSVWSCGAVPQAGDRVIVQHPVTVTPVPLNFVNQVRFEGAGKLIYEAGARLQMK